MTRMHMRVILALLLLGGLALAQTPTRSDLHLRGGRFKPVTYAELTPDQKTLVNNVLSGERASLQGPFNVYLRSPQTGDLAQKLGAHLRYHSSLPRKLNEFAILIVGRYWAAQFEWYVHKQDALAAGLQPAVIDAVAEGKRPVMDKEEATLYDFTTELLNKRAVSDKTYQAAKSAFGEKGVVDLVSLMGYYDLVCMVLDVDQYPLPKGIQPPLKPLVKSAD